MPISIEADPTLAQGYIKVNGTTAATISTAGIVSGGIPAGAVMPFAMNSAPSGWLAANGAQVSRSTYAALFAAIGTTYGAGDGSGTFNLPDLQGIFVRGSGSQTISGTAHAGTLAEKQGDAIRNITGNLTLRRGRFAGGTSGDVFTATTGPFSENVTDTGVNTPRINFEGTEVTSRQRVTFDASTVVPTADTNRPANIALLYCIKH